MFNKKIRLFDIEIGSLVWVEFGETKHLFLQQMQTQLKEDCFEINDCPHGLNLLHEFSYKHMAFLISDPHNDTVAVVPVTSYNTRDSEFPNLNIVLESKDFGLSLANKSTIKLDQMRFIDRSRIVKVERKFISRTLKNLIRKKLHTIIK